MAITNYDHCLHFQVLDKRITFVDDDVAEVVADNRGNICISIKFDEQWDGCGKTARFIYNGEWKDAVLDANGECICPSEVLKKGRFSLGVYGADLKVTTPIVVSVAASILSECEGELPDAPTDDVYQQILQISADANAAVDEATKACWEVVETTNDAINTINKIKTEMEAGGFVRAIQEQNKGLKLSFWIGSSEEYNALEEKDKNCFYILTDDPDSDALKQLEALLEDVNNMTQAHDVVINDMNDYVVEEGEIKPSTFSSFNWRFRKWSSGLYELWTKYTVPNAALTKQWGSLYASGTNEVVAYEIEFPRDLLSFDVISIDVAKTGYVIWAVPCGTTTNVPTGNGYRYYVCSVYSEENISFDTMISVKGRWK